MHAKMGTIELQTWPTLRDWGQSSDIGMLQGWRRESNASRTWVPLAGHKGLEGSDAENISLVDYKPCAWRNPICAAQSHYSFFEHYKSGSLEVRIRC